tara:strand:- start:118571 stop:119221 length:651 start_codon:yes stop_codon:yes gene_type:complete
MKERMRKVTENSEIRRRVTDPLTAKLTFSLHSTVTLRFPARCARPEFHSAPLLIKIAKLIKNQTISSVAFTSSLLLDFHLQREAGYRVEYVGLSCRLLFQGTQTVVAVRGRLLETRMLNLSRLLMSILFCISFLMFASVAVYIRERRHSVKRHHGLKRHRMHSESTPMTSDVRAMCVERHNFDSHNPSYIQTVQILNCVKPEGFIVTTSTGEEELY